MRLLILVVAVSIAFAGDVSAQAGQSIERANETTISEGEALYKSIGLCFACHGPTGTGVPGAGVNLTDEEWLHGDGSFVAILEQILSGVGAGQTKSGVIMLPRGGSQISDEQARAIASYVWSLSQRPVTF